MRKKFQDFNFQPKTLAMIKLANSIIESYMAMGYVLTLRQLYYQMVARDIIPNDQRQYKNLGTVINNARLAGLIDWDAIEDRTRRLRHVPHWGEPSSIIESAASSYRIDKWDDQDFYVEVWVEKDALVGVLEKACNKLDVPFFSCRGYGSQTALYDAGMRLKEKSRDGKEPIVIHLGDHDPSGIDMTRDIDDRLAMFVGHEVEIRRIALNWEQVQEYNPPPNPAKETDSRFKGYRDLHGDESWELDALDLLVVDRLITENVMQFRNEERWAVKVEREENERAALRDASNNWEDVEKFLRNLRDNE